jgi:uncharacterized cupredoxin-like copper-binding protein
MFGQTRKTQPGTRARVPAAIASAALAMAGVGALLASAQTVTPTTTAGACTVTPTSGASTPCVEIGEFDIFFNPNLATIPSDTAVTVELKNSGVTAHDFSVTDHGNPGLKNLNINVPINPGETKETTINAPEGVYYFFCNVPGHEAAGMRGYITVKKDGTITASEGTVTPRAG